MCCLRQGWACTQIFEGHSHYVMQCVFNPKDTNTFASASLDRTVKASSVHQVDCSYAVGPCRVTYEATSSQPGQKLQLEPQVWSLGQPTPNFTLEGHEKGVNAVDYFVGGVSRFTLCRNAWDIYIFDTC